MNGLRYAVRSLRGARLYTITVVSVLGIGVALCTVVFAVVDGVLFRPVPYPRPEELFVVRADRTTDPRVTQSPVTFGEIDAWRAAVPDAAMTATSNVPYRFKRTNGREYWAADIDEHFFDVVGTRPMVGGFSAEDFDWFKPEQGLGVRPVLVSYRYWRAELGGRREAIGRVEDAWRRQGMQWGERVVGVLPRDFVFPLDSDSPQPEILSPIARGYRTPLRADYRVLLRTPRPVASAGIRERLLEATRHAATAAVPGGHQRDAPFDAIRLQRAVDELGRKERPVFALTFGAAAVLLLLASVNVAGLTVARNVERRRSFAVCRALGAGTATLLRGQLYELGAIAAASAAAAVLVAKPMLAWTVSLLPPTVTVLKSPEIDIRVFAASATFALGAAALVAIWPVRALHRLSGPSSLGGSSGTVTHSGRGATFVLVASQVALAFVLVTAGALTVTSLAAAWLNDAGYRRDRMILVEAYIREYTSGADATVQLQQMGDLLSRLPGVEAVATSSIQPFFDSSTQRAFTGLLPQDWTGAPPTTSMRRVSAGYFEVMDLRLVDGRWPAAGEWTVEQPAAIVSETAARELWPGRPPLGQVLVASGRQAEQPRTVIGVVADTRYGALDRDPIGDIYIPDRLDPGRTGVFFHLRTSGDAARLVPIVARTLKERNVFTNQASTHESALFASVRHRALPAWLFGWLGVAALVLSGVGTLGLLAMSAAQRTREMGIRIALGATPARVIRLLMREQLQPVAAGLAGGAAIGFGAVRYADSLLYRVGAYDPAVWSAAALVLVLVAIVGTVGPAWRAARVNPVEALRAE